MSLLDLRRGHNRRGTQALRRGRVARDRRLDRGALAVLRRGRRPRREGRRRRDETGDRRRRGGAARPAARAQARRDPRQGGRRRSPAATTRSRADLRRGRQAAEGGSGRGLARDVDVHLRRCRGAQARRRDGADGRGAGRRGQARLHAAPPDRDRGRDLPVQLPAQPRRAQARARARGRLPGRPQAGDADAAVGAPARRARGGGGPAARLVERRRRPVGRDRRRAGRGRAREGDHLHRLGRRRLGAEGARAEEEGRASSSATRRR